MDLYIYYGNQIKGHEGSSKIEIILLNRENMLKIVKQVTEVVRGIFMYWDPMDLIYTTYVCMGTGEMFLEKLNKSVHKVSRDAKKVFNITTFAVQ